MSKTYYRVTFSPELQELTGCSAVAVQTWEEVQRVLMSHGVERSATGPRGDGAVFCAQERGHLTVSTVRTITVNGEPMEPGCYVDGHRGQYADLAAVELCDEITGTALADEWPTNDDGEPMGTYAEYGPWVAIVGPDEAADAVGTMVELSDRAVGQLNDHTTGGYWSWEDGELFLSAYEDEDDDE